MARTKHTSPEPNRDYPDSYVTEAGETVWSGNAPRRQFSRKELMAAGHKLFVDDIQNHFSSHDDSSEDSGLDTQKLAVAMIDHPPPPKKTKVEVVADAVPSAGLAAYDCETDEDTDHPTTGKQSDIDGMREQLKELKKKLEGKDAIISQLNERISDLEQGNCKMAAAAKKDDTDTDDDDVEVESERKVEQPKKKSKTFQRQNGLKIWARDSDKAEYYLAYLDDVDDQDEGDHVWIRRDTDITTAVRVHKSRIKDLENVYKNIYAWCEGYDPNNPTFYFLPYDRFIFWRKLVKCKTWGEIRAIADEAFCLRLEGRYERKWDWEEDDESIPDDKMHINNLNNDTEISMDDFDLQEHNDYRDCYACGCFPPLIAEIMLTEARADRERHGWIIDHGNVEGGIGFLFAENIFFDEKAKEAIFNDMGKGSGRAGQCAAIQCPELGIFPSIWDFS